MDTDMQEKVTPDLPTDNQTIVSDEEKEWSSLKGSTQDRVRQVITERNEYKTKLSNLEREVEELKSKTQEARTPPAPPVVEGQLTPEQQRAMETLKKFGVVTKEDLQALKDQQIIEDTYTKLELKYTGEDGKPAFDRSKIEKHMKDTGIYNPEKAYNDLYSEELFDLRMKERTSTTQPYTARPTAGAGRGGEPLTAESLQERLSKPDGREWWEKNRGKILPVMSELMK